MEIIRHEIIIQTQSFLTLLLTRQDGVENRDKVCWINSSKNVTDDWPFMMFRICP